MTYTIIYCLTYWLGICTTDPVKGNGVTLAECERVIAQIKQTTGGTPAMAYCRPERRPA